jgi:hypothetical protein
MAMSPRDTVGLSLVDKSMPNDREVPKKKKIEKRYLASQGYLSLSDSCITALICLDCIVNLKFLKVSWVPLYFNALKLPPNPIRDK